MAGNISARSLHAAAQKLDAAVKEKPAENLGSLLSNVEKALSHEVESVRAVGAEEDGRGAVPTGSHEGKKQDPIRVGGALARPSELLKGGNPAAEDCVGSIRQELCDHGLREETMLLVEQIDRLDFKNAQETLTRIAERAEVSLEGGNT